MNERPRSFEEAEERLASSLPGYESRTQQQTLARNVEQAIAEGQHLLAEAGCGTGKSLGYLIPAIISGKRIIISTATKALQDQVAYKDVPFLQEHLGVPFTFAILKGRSNYFCLNKALTVDPADCQMLPELVKIAQERRNDPAFTGEREEFGFEIQPRDWMQVCSESDDCSALECKDLEENGMGVCYAQRAKNRAKLSRVVIVNHALFLTDLMVREVTGGYASLLDEYDVVVFDEAHEVEEYAHGALGTQFREGGVRAVAGQVRNFVGRYVNNEFGQSVIQANARMLAAMEDLWSILEPGRIRTETLLTHGDQFVGFANALTELTDLVGQRAKMLDLVPQGKVDAVGKFYKTMFRRVQSLTERFMLVITASFDDLVRWVELDKGRPVLRSSPITVAPFLRGALFGGACLYCAGTGQKDEDDCIYCDGEGSVKRAAMAVLTSATMSVNGKFDYLAGRLGIETYQGLDVGTPFDFDKQARLYVPRHIPEPTPKNRGEWSTMAISEINNLVRSSDGRALILFTSVKQMRETYEYLSKRLPYTCLMQGQKPNKVLAEEFKNDRHSVLFATKSFMTGVDFQGDTCSLVIIDKMPFPVPTEPMNEAIIESIERNGGSSFNEFTIPVMTLTLKQAFGRLIRHRNDEGIVAILDPRLLTKGYGKKILDSLPPARRIDTQEQVDEFWKEAMV